MYERLTALQEGLIPKKKAATDDDLHRINELIQVGPVASQPKTKPLVTEPLVLLSVEAKADLRKPHVGSLPVSSVTRGTSREVGMQCLEQAFCF